jgi:predicted dienelactone hydrolase
MDVGPEAGVPAEGEDPPHFTLFRASDMTESGLCHPVITWGNGTGSTPSMYGVLLRQLASHGFVVIGSDSPNVAQGDPPPMLAGVTWILERRSFYFDKAVFGRTA